MEMNELNRFNQVSGVLKYLNINILNINKQIEKMNYNVVLLQQKVVLLQQKSNDLKCDLKCGFSESGIFYDRRKRCYFREKVVVEEPEEIIYIVDDGTIKDVSVEGTINDVSIKQINDPNFVDLQYYLLQILKVMELFEFMGIHLEVEQLRKNVFF